MTRSDKTTMSIGTERLWRPENLFPPNMSLRIERSLDKFGPEPTIYPGNKYKVTKITKSCSCAYHQVHSSMNCK